MKVSKIEVTSKGNYLTHTEGEDKLDKVIYTQKEPPWKLGEDLSPDNFELSDTGKSYRRKFKQAQPSPAVSPIGEKPPFSKDEDIFLSVAFKGAVELAIARKLPTDDEVTKCTQILYANLLKMRGSVTVEKK